MSCHETASHKGLTKWGWNSAVIVDDILTTTVNVEAMSAVVVNVIIANGVDQSIKCCRCRQKN